MNKDKSEKMIAELTPLEKVESLYSELTEWYGEADKKELRVAAKLLLVALDKFASYGQNDWDQLVMEYVDTLNKLDTKGITPTSHAIFLNNAFREDEEKQHLDTDAALANAPEKEDGSFIVPKVVG